MPNWLLPEFIADVLPSEARKMEDLRRKILDEFRSYGYELVIPPMLEYLESLLTGVGQDTEIYTFKLIDQLSGRTMGIRADMTTQVARIDAHLLNRNTVTRLCYAGSILHTRPSGLQATREPLQIGAEIFGYPGIEADAEIQSLALASLKAAGISGVCLDLSHVGVLKALIASDPLAQIFEAQLFDLLETKDMPGLIELTKGFHEDTRTALLALPSMYGDVEILKEAKKILPDTEGIAKALAELEYLAGQAECDRVTIDLADMHGYHYHSGVMFAAYVPGLPNAIARGGRYDHVAEAFGRSRPATGFSMDLRELARVLPAAEKRHVILAPWSDDEKLCRKIGELRQSGEIVVYELPNSRSEHDEFVCDRFLVQEADNGDWILKTAGNE
ncbi:ATP phosphoribosyltransferase regulatory subunit [Oxalobacter paraformigenes]|uniref:ATP phosphoribosyltransferase regulatory subunit n=1 Tax=Oxalobacter paraformigenes TaxID=556268 RepID=C3X176_9BURK|nr:ATP phosphoribosyltransferase regulatory subunit [Oxalobacter paraformigenes]EEO26962.1 ATP phosphoribosyltransferase, regulatory subunit [Oxalobacter paraformigenes]